jgi:NADPH:quinone reductase-like Zn-dependent oxidoreductase
VLGKPGVVREYPIVAGIDCVGYVRSSRSALFREGDAVVLTGNKAGQYFDGGYAQRATAQAEWLVPLPANLSPSDAMVIGTAGVTAMMCVRHLEVAGELRRCGRAWAARHRYPQGARLRCDRLLGSPRARDAFACSGRWRGDR